MGPMRALDWSTIQRLHMKDQTWGWNVEMQMKAIYIGLRVREIEVEYSKRKFGHSKISGSLFTSIRAGAKIISKTIYYYFWNLGRKKRE